MTNRAISGSEWATVDELVTKVRARWERGTYLRAYAQGAAFEPVSLPVRAPTATDVIERLEDVQRWVHRFDVDNRTGSDRQRFAVERAIRRSRVLGDNPVPVRVHIESFEQLCVVLGTATEVEKLDDVVELSRFRGARLPDDGALLDWVTTHPREAVAHHDAWASLLAVVVWIVDHNSERADLDVRHLDVPGVDTKFVERHRKVLGRLLECVLPAEHVDRTATTFAGRFGFRPRPTHVRFRLLVPVPELPEVITEAELRVDELARLPLSVTTVFVVENRATFLAFPRVTDAMVFNGSGFGVTVLEGVSWLADRELVYWGDIDTHGFVILNRLRQRVPGVRSLLMDRATLLAHRDHVVTEERPTTEPLAMLTDEERAVYRDLIEDRYGAAVRLEQERIRFSVVRQALAPWL